MKTTVIRALLVGLCVLLVGLSAAPAGAQPPQMPHAFYGVLEVNGEPAPPGTQVEARGTDVLTGVEGNPITTTEVGKYGGRGGFDPKLVVQGSVEGYAPLEFYVDGVRAQCAEPGGEWLDSYPFMSGSITELNLRAGEAAAPTGEPTEGPTPTVLPPTPTGEAAEEPGATVVATPTSEAAEEPGATVLPPAPTSEAAVEPVATPTSPPAEEPVGTEAPTAAKEVSPVPTTRRDAVVVTPTVEAPVEPGGDSFSIALYGLILVAVVVVLIWVRRSGAAG